MNLMANVILRSFIRSQFYKRNFCSFVKFNSDLNISNGNFQTNASKFIRDDGRIHEIKSLLTKHGFSSKEIYSFVSFCLKNPDTKNFSINDLEERILFWQQNIFEFSSKAYSITSVNHIITRILPELMFIDISLMKQRINNLLKIGFISGKKQIFLLFSECPRAFFLQDWNEVRKKFYYLQYRVVEWLLNKQKNKYPDPHPIVEYPQVMEREYNFIKSRHKFAVATGINRPDKFIDKNGNVKLINFKMLFVEDIDKYLLNIAPNCKKEEYLVFEHMININEDDEDKIFDDLGKGLTVNNSEDTDKNIFSQRLSRFSLKHLV